MKQYINSLEEYKTVFIETTKNVLLFEDSSIVYNIFICSVLNRSMIINRGFLSLTKDNNYFCAIPLLRMQVDNCLRFFGIRLYDNPIDYIEKSMSGTKISSLKDKVTNHKLSDSYLAQQLNVHYTNVKNIYDDACKYVHLSEESLYNAMHIKPGTRTISGHVNGHDMIPDNVKTNITKCMLYVNNILIDIISSFVSDIRNGK